tara:strand:- start:1028 stop:2383 length:1356 start_codon:yes stop_codon:yes gene_type:complete
MYFYKKLITMKPFLFCLLLPIFSYAQFLSPSTPYILSSGSAEGYERPRVVITANNSPFVIWSKPSTPKAIKARKWNGTDFDSAFNLVSADLMPTGFIGPEIAAKGDTVYLIFESLLHSNHIIYLKRSFDGGFTFSDTIRVSGNSNTNYFFMPNVAVKEDGNPVISYMLSDSTGYKQIVRVSSNFGNTFSSEADASALAPGEPCDCCQSTLVTNGDNVYLLFRNDDNNVRNSYIAQSTDEGLTFTATQDLDDINWVLNSCPTSSPVGAVLGDSIMVVRRNGGSGVNELYKSNVNKDDLQKSYFTQLESAGSPFQDKVEIATDLNNFISVWEENRNGNKECFYSVIGSDGKSLYNGIISDTATFGHKMEPDITYGGPYSGNFSVVYTASTQHEVHFVYGPLMYVSAIDEASDLNDKKLLKIVNLLGKNVIPESNKPFVNIYNDGTVERKIVLE